MHEPDRNSIRHSGVRRNDEHGHCNKDVSGRTVCTGIQYRCIQYDRVRWNVYRVHFAGRSTIRHWCVYNAIDKHDDCDEGGMSGRTIHIRIQCRVVQLYRGCRNMYRVLESVGFTVRVRCVFDICRHAVWEQNDMRFRSVHDRVRCRNIQCSRFRWNM